MIRDQIETVQRRVSEACRRAGRDVKEIELVLVTKQVEPDKIREAYDAGIRDFGENRVQEMTRKIGELPADVRWHFVGRLQTNKAKDVVGRCVLIHSCDRLDIAWALDRQAEKTNVAVRVLVQVNTSAEASKQGFSFSEAEVGVNELVKLKHIQIAGLMTIGPLTEDQSQIRSAFQKLRELRDRFRNSFPNQDWRYLSMGMSGDFEIAIEEGANCLRIGQAVFGLRETRKDSCA